jgi:hypothetical protein
VVARWKGAGAKAETELAKRKAPRNFMVDEYFE